MALKTSSKTIKYGIIRQNLSNLTAGDFMAAGSTTNQWTNPAAVSTNFRGLYYTKGVPIPDPGVTIDDYGGTSQYGLNHDISQFYVDARSGLPKFNFSGPVDVNTLVPHLVGALQGDTEGTSGEDNIVSGFTAGTIDFAAGGGYLHTIACKNGASADDGWILENAVIDTLNLTWDFNAKGVARLVQMDGTWVGNEMNFDQTLSGTWISTTLTPLNNADSFSFTTLSIDSVDLKAQCIRRVTLSINNNVTSNCSTTSGKANQYDFNPEITWTIIMDHNNATEKLMGDFQAGAAVSLVLASSTAAGNTGYLTITTATCRIIAPPQAYNGDFLGYSV